MATTFQTKLRRARFVVSGLTAQEMASLGQTLADSIRERIRAGLDVSDNPSPPLKRPLRDIAANRNVISVKGQTLIQLPGKRYRGYPDFKSRKGLKPIRDWTLSGRTLRSMKVLSASENRATIGFADAVTNLRAALNNRRWRQFGVSPRDREKLLAAIRNMRLVKAEAA